MQHGDSPYFSSVARVSAHVVKKIVPVVLLVLVAAAAAAWWLKKHNAQGPPGELVLHGNVDIREVTLGFRVSGRIAEVLKDEGDRVKPGEVLAKLDDAPYRREADEARARLESAAARLQLLEAGARPQEIAQARAAVQEREVISQNSERLYRRQEELFAANAVSTQERDDAQARFKEAEARLNSAREQLNLLQAGFRSEEIAQARSEMARAQAAVAQAELRLADTVMKSPAESVVLVRAQEPGAVVAPGAVVLSLSLDRPVWVRAYVHEPDLGRIQPGMRVQVFTDSRPGKPYAGQIGFISPRAEFTPKNVETAELRTTLVYRVRIPVDEGAEELRQGMPVVVRFPTGK